MKQKLFQNMLKAAGAFLFAMIVSMRPSGTMPLWAVRSLMAMSMQVPTTLTKWLGMLPILTKPTA